MASEYDVAVVRFDTLPELVLRLLFLALPVDARARAACVCRSWRAFLADPSLWQVLDLTPSGGAGRVTENLVRGAVARAAGQLRSLSMNDLVLRRYDSLMVELIVSDGAELRQLHTNDRLSVAELVAVFTSAPRLQVLNAHVAGGCTALLPIVRKEAPYGPLRIISLEVDFSGDDAPEADVLALAAAVASHESLRGLVIHVAVFAGGVNALVDAAAQLRIAGLAMNDCEMDADIVPALTRLLQRGSLTNLAFRFDYRREMEVSVPELCTALRACHTLTYLVLRLMPIDGGDRYFFPELVEAAAALPALRYLDFCASLLEDTDAAGRALGALLAANLPSLRTLNVRDCGLEDAGLAALLDGLAANTHLRELECLENHESEAFTRNRLDPALAALAARAELDA